MIDRKALLADLIKQVKAVEADLRQQIRVVPEVHDRLRAEFSRAGKVGRTGIGWTEWSNERATQAAVAWVLGTVFVRFCEDNGLIGDPYLAAPERERFVLAQERQEDFLAADAARTHRDWLTAAFGEIGSGQAGRLLFDRKHNALYQVPISHDAAKELVAFWRLLAEDGALVHDFTDPLVADGGGDGVPSGWDTRFLGDLYQDLSESARKTYALLQTPEFVEEFILDRTLNKAVDEFGYEGLRMIDPTCGSGHFVLGTFWRLFGLWTAGRPGEGRWSCVREAMDSVHGVDINPFAVAIARFRLLVAGMAAAGMRTLAEAGKYDWPMHLAVGDALIKDRQLEVPMLGEEGDPLVEFSYATEDIHELEHKGILEEGSYHVVVGNPPYITVKDTQLNGVYRKIYGSCSGAYALSVPFAERFFQLAKAGGADGRGYGYVGQITSNSFMKREFGKKLIQEYFAYKVELVEVIDTSGAYIPGHGTPTVILIGRRRVGNSRAAKIRVIQGIKGESAPPAVPADGHVWRSILRQIDQPGSESDWVSVRDVLRATLSLHPWSLSGGGASELMTAIEAGTAATLGNVAADIGAGAVTREDDAYTVGPGFLRRKGIEDDYRRPLVEGTELRDFGIVAPADSLWPYSTNTLKAEASDAVRIALWPARALLQRRIAFGKTQLERGLSWFEYSMFFAERYRTPASIAFAFVATHNHFVFDRGGKVFNRSAPVIKLHQGATEEDHFRLLGLLNSSAACFWLKQVSHDKGIRGEGGGFTSEDWERFYEFTGTKLQEFPIPAGDCLVLATALDQLAQQLSATTPTAVWARRSRPRPCRAPRSSRRVGADPRPHDRTPGGARLGGLLPLRPHPRGQPAPAEPRRRAASRARRARVRDRARAPYRRG